MKKNYFLYLIIGFTVLFGLVIRLSNLDKPTGLWYDEMVLYSIGSKHFFSGMLNADSHRFLLFPLYFLTYKSWLALFGNSDIAIRLMSVFFDILSVISAYFVGIYFAQLINKDEVQSKIGMYNVLLYAINSSLIYYAQEAKFYSMLIFLINLMIIFWLKMIKNPTITNKILFLGSNFLLLYTSTLQALLIIIIQAVTFLYLYIYRRDNIKKYLSIFLGMFVIFIPLIIMIALNNAYFSGDFNSVVYDDSFIFLVIQNWFTPILVGLQNNVLSYQWVMLLNIFNIKWWVFIFLPIIFYFILLFKGSKKEPVAKLFLSIVFIYILVHILLTKFWHYHVLIRYVMPALPFVLIVCANGLEQIKKRGFVIALVAINIFALLSPVSATKITRPNGYRELASLLVSNKISPEQSYVLPIRVTLLDKYFYITGPKSLLYSLNSESCQKTYLTKYEINEIKSKQNMYGNYKRFFLSQGVTKDFENYVKTNFIDTIPQGKDLVVVTDKSICLLSNKQILEIVKGNKVYDKYPLQFLRLSKLNNNLINVLSKHLKIKNRIDSKNWKIYVFSKL